ncbi:MAG: rhodanese-like domain-containing protein [Ilumatobacteraceae bacterium]
MTRSARSLVRILVATMPVFAIAACGSADEPPSAVGADPAYGSIDAARVAELSARGVTVIDVRTPEEYAEGHVEGAELIDFYEPTFAERIAALDRDRDYIVYCRSGNRSGQAVELMEQLGFGRVWELEGGVLAIGDDLELVP